ncbi:hypothetical protein [Sinorhizobium psoraleae]|uniref:Uncharacterized protein n=1 Tax=Sinorhizobium psoraleae TaxID=520838 RepID=A0ABT4KCZ0_9HYPH|nr:hypothetical protein [Sinorhizobium psoraleae]MCZ4089762.1 hypothetical protein [Sinorhizobium psoraleae]
MDGDCEAVRGQILDYCLAYASGAAGYERRLECSRQLFPAPRILFWLDEDIGKNGRPETLPVESFQKN